MQRIFAPTLVALLLSATHAYAATTAPTQAPGLGAAQPPVITGPIGLGPAAVAAPAEAGVPGVMVLGSAPFDVRFLLGGSAAGAVVVEKQGPDGVSRKHLSGVRYEPIVVEAVPATPLDAWIGAFLSSAPARKDGALMEGAIPPGQQLAFKNALLSDVTFPACDARGKDLGRIRATIAPELATTGAVQGAAAVAPKAKAWLAHNFAFSIPGLETQRVVRIEAITARRSLPAANVGEIRDYTKLNVPLEVSNVVVTLSVANEAAVSGWLKWYEDFVIKGDNGQAREKQFSLQYLSEDMKTPIATLSGQGVGIVSLHFVAGAEEAIRQLQVELYVEQLALHDGAATK